MKQYLSKHQMRFLAYIGLDINDASNAWITELMPTGMVINKAVPATMAVNGCPCYSLSEVIKKLPNSIYVTDNHCTYYLSINKRSIAYICDGKENLIHYSSNDNNELIDACFDMLCYVINMKYATINNPFIKQSNDNCIASKCTDDGFSCPDAYIMTSDLCKDCNTCTYAIKLTTNI